MMISPIELSDLKMVNKKGYFWEITTNDIRDTVEHPDEIMNNEGFNICSYIKIIEGKGKLLVTAINIRAILEVKSFGWIIPIITQTMMYKQYPYEKEYKNNDSI